jgi:hypothetical protein
LLKTAIRDDNPVVIFEDKLMYNDKAPVPEEEYLIPFGEAAVLREGRDVHTGRDVFHGSGLQKAAEIAGSGRDLGRSDRPADHRAAGRGHDPELGAQDVAAPSSSTRGTRISALLAKSPAGFPKRRSTTSTRRFSAWARWTCRCRFRRRWRTSPYRRPKASPNARG